MAKKAQNKVKTQRSGTLKTKVDVARKTLRRRSGDVRRVEVVLVADSPRDQYISEWMNDFLVRGEQSEFVRQAIEEKIARELLGHHGSAPQAVVASDQVQHLYAELADERRRASEQFETLIQEIHALRQQLATFQISARETVREVHISAAPIDTAQTVSSGISMDRPRPRKALPTAPPTPDALPELTEDDRIRLAKQMADSIAAYSGTK